jgi:hypothetical protein
LYLRKNANFFPPKIVENRRKLWSRLSRDFKVLNLKPIQDLAHPHAKESSVDVRVTRWVCEKNHPKCIPKHIRQNLCTHFPLEKVALKFWLLMSCSKKIFPKLNIIQIGENSTDLVTLVDVCIQIVMFAANQFHGIQKFKRVYLCSMCRVVVSCT